MLAETDNLIRAFESANGDALKKASGRVRVASQKATPQERSEVLCRVAPFILTADEKCSATAAVVCGSIIEHGADPAPVEQPLLKRFLPLLEKIASEPAPEPEAQIPTERTLKVEVSKRGGLLGTIWTLLTGSYKLRRAVKKAAAEGARSEQPMVMALGCAAIAMFSAKPSLRAAHPEVLELAKSLADRVGCYGWLETIFSVLENEPLLVIEPSTRTGMLAHLSGTDSNFILNMLLMRDFPGKPRLSAKAAQVLEGGPQHVDEVVKGAWNLYNWEAIESDHSVPPGQRNSVNWIWNEGTPADISRFEGRRVILLGPPAYARSWPAQRTFAAMKPELRIEKVLTPDEVDVWLEKMVQSRPTASAA